MIKRIIDFEESHRKEDLTFNFEFEEMTVSLIPSIEHNDGVTGSLCKI